MSTSRIKPEWLDSRPSECYTIGWLCALPHSELPAARMMLDHWHRPALSTNADDENVYHYGDISGHNVVVAHTVAAGNRESQQCVRPLRRSFPNLRLHLFVGIGGGVPQSPPCDDPYKDVRLGDVVVSNAIHPNAPAVVQYDSVDYLPNGDFRLRGSLEKPSRQLLAALGAIVCDKELEDTNYDTHLTRLSGRSDFEHPGLENDVLFNITYPHDQGRVNCDGCDRAETVQRKSRDSQKMVFHESTILSGEGLMKDPIFRDQRSQKFFNALCFEMEAAGVMEDTRCLIIRGIATYADSHKNLSWQKYAAATAAAFAREVIHKIPHVTTTVNDSTLQNPRNSDNAYSVSPPSSQYSRDYESRNAGDVGLLVSEDRVYSSSDGGRSKTPIPRYREQRTLTQGVENAGKS